MRTKHYDLLNHSNDLNELLAEITANTEIVITRGNTPIARLLPTDVDDTTNPASGETIAILLTEANASSPNSASRKPNLHPGALVGHERGL